MTRPTGKLLKADSTSDILSAKELGKIFPEKTLKYKVYRFIKESKKPLLVNDIHRAISPSSPRRTFEKILFDLANQGIVKRKKCTCGMSHIYTK